MRTVPLLPIVLAACAPSAALRADDVAHAERLVALRFTERQRRLMLHELGEQRDAYLGLRKLPLANALAPWGAPLPAPDAPAPPLRMELPAPPAALPHLGFATVTELAALLRARKV